MTYKPEAQYESDLDARVGLDALYHGDIAFEDPSGPGNEDYMDLVFADPTNGASAALSKVPLATTGLRGWDFA